MNIGTRGPSTQVNDPQAWVRLQVNNVLATTSLDFELQDKLVALAADPGLIPADIRFMATATEPSGKRAFEQVTAAVVHQALAKNLGLNREIAQFLVDHSWDIQTSGGSKTSAGYTGVMHRPVEESILANPNCRPFMGELQFHILK